MAASQRPAVVLLHCSGSTAAQWQPLVERLQPRFRALALDLHGHGLGPEWSGTSPFTLAHDAALVTPLLERLGGVHLVGHSYGGAVALKAASLSPALVHSVTAYEPVFFRALFDDPAGQPEMAEVMQVAHSMRTRLSENDGRSAAQRFVEYWSGADAWRYLPPTRQAAIAARMPSVVRHFDAVFGEPFAPEAWPAGVPKLFLGGEESVASARHIARRLRALLPDATHETLPGMGHMGPMTHPAIVNPCIDAFLRSSDSARAEVSSRRPADACAPGPCPR